MELTITARHVNLKDSLRDYMRTKVEKLARFYDGIINLEVIVSQEKASRCTEFVINVQNKTIVIKEDGAGLRESFDLAMDRARRQIKRYKSKTRLKR